MKSSSIKRIAADILGVGINRIKLNVEKDKERIEKAITRDDIKSLIKDNIITVKPAKTKKCSKALGGQKKKRGIGSRKGKKYSRKSKKEIWMEKVRALRKYLNQLVDEGKVERKNKRKLYLKIKSGVFRGKKAFYTYLKDNNYLKEVEINGEA